MTSPEDVNKQWRYDEKIVNFRNVNYNGFIKDKGASLSITYTYMSCMSMKNNI